MKASKLSDRITLQQKSQIQDGQGGLTQSWQVVRNLWANWQPLSSNEVVKHKAVESNATVRCVIRYRTDIDETMRISYRGKTYAIDGEPVPDNMSGLEYLTLMLKRTGDD